MSDWMDREEQEICDDFNNGTISEKEFNAAMRDLREEIQRGAQDAADEAYNEYMR